MSWKIIFSLVAAKLIYDALPYLFIIGLGFALYIWKRLKEKKQ